jgi:hypothetical protein
MRQAKMTILNLSNKIAVIPQISVNSGRTTSRRLIDVAATGINAEHIVQRVELTETIADKNAFEKIRVLQTKANASLTKLCSMPIKGLHVVDCGRRGEVEAVIAQLQTEARELTASLVGVGIEIDCALVPVELDATPDSARLIAAHIQAQLREVLDRITKPDMTIDPMTRYGNAYNAVRKCAHLPEFATGVNAGAVVAGLEEARDACKLVKSAQPPTTLPALEAAIELFNLSTDTVQV